MSLLVHDKGLLTIVRVVAIFSLQLFLYSRGFNRMVPLSEIPISPLKISNSWVTSQYVKEN